MEVVDTRLKIPGCLVIVGASGCGKTMLVASMLNPKNQEAVFGRRINKIYYLYTIWQPTYDRIKEEHPDVQFLQKFSQIPQTTSDEPQIVVWDDMFLTFQTDKRAKSQITDVSFRLAHHCNSFNIIIFQCLHGHNLRHVVLNSQYLLIFPIKSDMSSIRYVSRQMFPDSDSRFLQDALIDVSKDKWGYLLLDRSPNQDPCYAVRNFVYPTTNGKFYIPKEYGENCKK